MILADTSIWIDHFRSGEVQLADLLDRGGVVMHPWVVGEIALGNLRNRAEVIGLLRNLPQAVVAEDDEVLVLVERETVHGNGIGYVDAQLLAAARLTPGTRLWTRDRRLARTAERLGLDFEPDRASRR